jgi:hypothetical protein
MFVGNHLRDKKRLKEDNKRKVQSVKKQKNDETMSIPLKTKVYGGL